MCYAQFSEIAIVNDVWKIKVIDTREQAVQAFRVKLEHDVVKM